MPDALSKTIPIWTTVLNTLLFPHIPSSHSLYLPPTLVSPSEHAQITALLPSFISTARSLNLPLANLRAKVCKPLRPLWITPSSPLPDSPPEFEDFCPVVCVTVSRVSVAEELPLPKGAIFVQGAADDAEYWAPGLSAEMFWERKEELLALGTDEEVEEAVARIVREEKAGAERGEGTQSGDAKVVKEGTGLHVGPISAALDVDADAEWDVVIEASTAPTVAIEEKMEKRYLHLVCRSGKLGSRDLRRELSKLIPFLNGRDTTPRSRILVCDAQGGDHAAGVALAVLCGWIEGQMCERSKDGIRKQLAIMEMAVPEVRPARSTVLSVNDFLMSRLWGGNR